MNRAIERLLSLRVADAMSRNVISISSHDTMADAARKLLDHSISGAPVVNDEQRCAGMLSAIDFLKCRNSDGDGGSGDSNLACRSMTPDVHSMAAADPLLDAARRMCEVHIHHLPVLDDRGRPVGMITALDIVAALVNAIEESRGATYQRA